MTSGSVHSRTLCSFVAAALQAAVLLAEAWQQGLAPAASTLLCYPVMR